MVVSSCVPCSTIQSYLINDLFDECSHFSSYLFTMKTLLPSWLLASALLLNPKLLYVYLYPPWTLPDLSSKQWHHLGVVKLLSLILYQHVLKKISLPYSQYIYLHQIYVFIYLFLIPVSWCQIYSRSCPTHQRCFNFILSYRTPIDMKPVGLIPKFHKWISIKNSALSSTCSRSYTRNIGAIRICKLCWPSYLQYSISRAIDLRLR
jgi:hypothetical protein